MKRNHRTAYRTVIGIGVTIFALILEARGADLRLEEVWTLNGEAGGHPFRSLSSLAYDITKDEYLLADTDAKQVIILDRRGELSGILGREGELRAPVGVAADGKGRIFVGERDRGEIKVFAGGDTRLSEPPEVWNLPSTDEGIGPSPGKMAVGPAGDLYVVDSTGGWILVFDAERRFRYRIGSQGREKKAFSFLQDVACDARGWIYAASRGTYPLTLFDRDGAFLRPVRDIRAVAEDVVDPIGLAVDAHNRLWVLDGARNRLVVFGPQGQHIGTLEESDFRGGLFLPVDIEFDRYDHLVLAERGAARVRLFVPRVD